MVCLGGGGQLGIYCHGKAQLIAKKLQLLGVFGITHAGNGVAGAQPASQNTGEHIDLIRAGDSNEQVGLLGPRLT